MEPVRLSSRSASGRGRPAPPPHDVGRPSRRVGASDVTAPAPTYGPPGGLHEETAPHLDDVLAGAGLEGELSWRDRLFQATGGLVALPDGGAGRRWLVPTAVVLALVIVVALVFGRGTGSATTEEWDAALPVASAPVTSSATTNRTTGETATGAPGTVPVLWVAVAGAVHRPGLYHLDAGARLSELLTAAGGPAADADADRINLAAPLRDGQRVYVPRRGESAAPPVIAGEAPPAAAGPTPGAGDAGGASIGPVNLNTASAEDLDRLPGVGPATAASIIQYRSAHGSFSSVDELAKVRGIGPAKLAQLRDLVSV